MNKLLLIILILTCTSCVKAQERKTDIDPLSIYFGIGIGNKSHYGNFGLSTNFFVTSFLSARLSMGASVFNRGGGTISVGPEISFLNSPRGFFRIGSMWSYTGEGFDIFGDDDSDDHVFYHTSYMKNLRSHLGYTFRLNSIDLTIEAGYSYNLSDYSYYFTGPGTPTQHDHNRVVRGLRSGWTASVYVGSFLFKKKKNASARN